MSCPGGIEGGIDPSFCDVSTPFLPVIISTFILGIVLLIIIFGIPKLKQKLKEKKK